MNHPYKLMVLSNNDESSCEWIWNHPRGRNVFTPPTLSPLDNHLPLVSLQDSFIMFFPNTPLQHLSATHFPNTSPNQDSQQPAYSAQHFFPTYIILSNAALQQSCPPFSMILFSNTCLQHFFILHSTLPSTSVQHFSITLFPLHL